MKTVIYVNPTFSRFFDDLELQEFIREHMNTQDPIHYHSIDMENLMNVVKNDELFSECLSSPMFYNGLAAYQYEQARNLPGIHINACFVGLTTQPEIWVEAVKNTFEMVSVIDLSYQSYLALCNKHEVEPVEEEAFNSYTDAIFQLMGAIHGVTESVSIH